MLVLVVLCLLAKLNVVTDRGRCRGSISRVLRWQNGRDDQGTGLVRVPSTVQSHRNSIRVAL